MRTQGEAGVSAVAKVYDAQVYRYRDTLLPLIFLHDALEIEGAIEASLTDSGEAALNIAVLHAEGSRFGLVVDEILSSQEIVVKALVDSLRQTQVFSGATILGDGRVALILDAPGLARHCGVASPGGTADLPIKSAVEPDHGDANVRALPYPRRLVRGDSPLGRRALEELLARRWSGSAIGGSSSIAAA